MPMTPETKGLFGDAAFAKMKKGARVVNVARGGVIDDAALVKALDAGIVATVNSDDPAYFGGYLNQNFVETFAALPLNAHDAHTLAQNSFEASFASPEQKRAQLHKLEAYCERAL